MPSPRSKVVRHLTIVSLAVGLVSAAALAQRSPTPPAVRPLPLPDGKPGIGFDDLRFDVTAHRLLIPAGRSGNLDLIDPATDAITAIGGFTRSASWGEGHGQSVTSVDAGDGLLFATDRDARVLAVVDATARKIVARVKLAAGPDYVRFVAPTRELWVTEPRAHGIEIFALGTATPPVPTHAGFIDVPGGPESLVVDARRGRAYTHDWKDTTNAIELKSRRVVARWRAGCAAPRGIALDDARGFLFVGCEDGTAAVLDVAHDGKLLSTAQNGRGVDIIAYDPGRAHLYLPGDESATMAIFGVGKGGALSLLGVVPTVADAHCVTTDEAGRAYVCDPRHGQLLVVRDPYPPSGR